jgi:hypothetical protein
VIVQTWGRGDIEDIEEESHLVALAGSYLRVRRRQWRNDIKSFRLLRTCRDLSQPTRRCWWIARPAPLSTVRRSSTATIRDLRARNVAPCQWKENSLRGKIELRNTSLSYGWIPLWSVDQKSGEITFCTALSAIGGLGKLWCATVPIHK